MDDDEDDDRDVISFFSGEGNLFKVALPVGP